MSMQEFVEVLREDRALRDLLSIVVPPIERLVEESRSFLCIAPHPDDCELGAGGTLSKLARRGKRVFIAVVTDGSKGTADPSLTPERLAAIRRAEQENAAKVLSVEKVYFLGYPDGELELSNKLVSDIVNIIRDCRPDIVFAPDPFLPYEAHLDHYYTGRAASMAAMMSGLPNYGRRGHGAAAPWFVKALFYYYTANSNVYVDISDTFAAKLEALKKHESQMSASWQYWERVLNTLHRALGRVINAEYAEAFRVVPSALAHVLTTLTDLIHGVIR